YAFGHQLEADTSNVVRQLGGRVVGGVRTPLNAPDFSSFLLQAQSSRAKIIGLANAGGDTINSIKQAGEFGIVRRGQSLAGLLIFITDIHGLGLETAHGLISTTPYKWQKHDGTRAFAQRFQAANRGIRPTMVHAGVYSAVTHYLKAVEAARSTADGKAIVDRMKATPTADALFGEGSIRADGRKIHDMYLYEVKKPSESRGAWDYYKLRATIPAAQAFRPIAEGNCPLTRG
ncbi:MAG: ABC transporter substrate-binding protein, partial [Tagaea sp.]